MRTFSGAGVVPAHTSWSPAEVRRLRFVRWAVERGAIGDRGHTGCYQLARSPDDGPRNWDSRDVLLHERQAAWTRPAPGYDYW